MSMLRFESDLSNFPSQFYPSQRLVIKYRYLFSFLLQQK
jgi:hypothetical protein